MILVIKNMYSNESMEAKIPALLGNIDRQTNRPTEQQTDRLGDREVTLTITLPINWGTGPYSIIKLVLFLFVCLFKQWFSPAPPKGTTSFYVSLNTGLQYVLWKVTTKKLQGVKDISSTIPYIHWICICYRNIIIGSSENSAC